VRLWRDGAATTTPRLLDVAERSQALFADQRPEGLPLRDELGHALADRATAANAPQIARLLERLAADEPVGGGAASVLGEHAPDFVAAQAKRWRDGAIDWLEEAARTLAMFRRDAILPFLIRGSRKGELSEGQAEHDRQPTDNLGACRNYKEGAGDSRCGALEAHALGKLR
jgi:hypothetical protein